MIFFLTWFCILDNVLGVLRWFIDLLKFQESLIDVLDKNILQNNFLSSKNSNQIY